MKNYILAVFRGLIPTMMVLSSVGPVSAGPLNPGHFVPLGSWSVGSGNYTIDTDALTITDDAAPGVPLFTGVIDDQGGSADSFGPGGAVTTVGANGIPHIAVFTFENLVIEGTTTLTVTGHRALALLSHGDILIDRPLDLSGGYPDGGAGGFDGGFADSTTALDGLGPGAGGANPDANFAAQHAGPAGYGSDGDVGGGSGTAGQSYGDLLGDLQGGSGGGGSRSGINNSLFAFGGGGGGALEIAGLEVVELGPNALLRVDGNAGVALGGATGSGPGSGGAVRISGSEIVLEGSISAEGASLRAHSGGGRVYLEGLGFYLVGTAFDPASLVANVSVAGSAADAGVIFLEPKQTIVPFGESLVLEDQEVSAASQSVPELTVRLGDVLIIGEAIVPAGGGSHPGELRLSGVASRITGGDPLVISGSLAGSGTAQVPVTIAAGGSLDLGNDTMTFPGDGNGVTDDGLVNLGTMNLINSTINGDVRSPAGTTVNVAGTATFNGLFKGAAGFSGTSNDVVFNGGYEPGDSPAAVGFGGGLTLGSGNVLRMEVGGPDPGAGYDQLIVAGHLTVGGTLEVSYLPPYLSAGGQVLNLFDFGSLSGTFDSIDLPHLPAGRTWDTSHLYTEGIIAVVGSTTFGSEHPGLSMGGDENGNGISNYAEYAQGFDPGAPNNPLPGPSFSDGARLSFELRSNAADVFSQWVTSSDLEPGSWRPLVQGADYTLLQINESGSRQQIVIELLPMESVTRRFIRIEFNGAP